MGSCGLRITNCGLAEPDCAFGREDEEDGLLPSISLTVWPRLAAGWSEWKGSHRDGEPTGAALQIKKKRCDLRSGTWSGNPQSEIGNPQSQKSPPANRRATQGEIGRAA